MTGKDLIERITREADRTAERTGRTPSEALKVQAAMWGMKDWDALRQRLESLDAAHRDARALLELALWKHLPQISGCRHILVTGSAGTGRTAFLNRLLRECPSSMRISAIEEGRGLSLPEGAKRIATSFAASPATEAHLIEQALSDSPDLLILGEINARTAVPVIDAMAVDGGPIVLSTIDASTFQEAIDAVSRHAAPIRPGAGLPAGVAIARIERFGHYVRHIADVRRT